jgi:hypothetical protein
MLRPAAQGEREAAADGHEQGHRQYPPPQRLPPGALAPSASPAGARELSLARPLRGLLARAHRRIRSRAREAGCVSRHRALGAPQ